MLLFSFYTVVFLLAEFSLNLKLYRFQRSIDLFPSLASHTADHQMKDQMVERQFIFAELKNLHLGSDTRILCFSPINFHADIINYSLSCPPLSFHFLSFLVQNKNGVY